LRAAKLIERRRLGLLLGHATYVAEKAFFKQHMKTRFASAWPKIAAAGRILAL
jgi:hypothetical protein